MEAVAEQKTRRKRIQFIDFTRGLVMALMGWDHVTGFWNEVHAGIEGLMPTRNPSIDLAHFMSRFITHFCAPTFVFLAGTSLALSVLNRQRKGVPEASIDTHIVIRGLVLIALEPLVVSPAFGLPSYYFGVIASIGVSLIIFALVRRLNPDLILIVSLLLVLNHQFIDLSFIPDDVAWGHYLRVIIHEPGFDWIPYVGLYPVIPWIGVMGIGYWFGSYLSEKETPSLVRPLSIIGVSSMTLFVIVRYLNGFGSLVFRWGTDIRDWLYVSKYPPSVAFLLWTLGGMCLFMALGQILDQRGVNNPIVSGINTLGRNPLFFYLTHLWVYRARLPNVPAPFYFTLPETVLVWLTGLVVLLFLTSKYEEIKRRNPDSLLRFI
jgi:uncharacterized membrane protein